MNNLASLISMHAPHDGDVDFRLRFAELLQQGPVVLTRAAFTPGHITGSGLVLHLQSGQVLLNRHKIFDKWLSFGGHADGDADIENVAMREVLEESGLQSVQRLGDGIIDLDIHPIGENSKKQEPAHFHYDVRYIFATPSQEIQISDESLDLAWCSLPEAKNRATTPGMARLLKKAEYFLK